MRAFCKELSMSLRRFPFRLALAVLLMPLLLLPGARRCVAEVRSHAVVETGELDGDIEDGLRVFEGIPYAAPPVGELRWRAPKPPLPWTGARAGEGVWPRLPPGAKQRCPGRGHERGLPHAEHLVACETLR